MKYLKSIICLTICLMVTGCYVESPPPGSYSAQTLRVCDEDDCQIETVRVYENGDWVYWSPRFGVWVGNNGYWYNRQWNHDIDHDDEFHHRTRYHR